MYFINVFFNLLAAKDVYIIVSQNWYSTQQKFANEECQN